MVLPSDLSTGATGSPAEPSGTGNNLIWLVGFIGAVTAALQLFSAWYPSWANWGTHHLAFLPPWTRIAVPLAMLAALLPVVQRPLAAALERLTGRPLARPRRLLLAIAALALLGAAFWFARQRTYFLGDGYLNLRGIKELDAVDHLHFQFEKEPLCGLIVWRLYRLLAGWSVSGAELLAYQLVSIASGCVAVAAMMMTARTLAAGALDRLLLFLIILASGGTQLFFGYAENYALAYAVLLLYGAAAAAYLRGQAPLVAAAALYAVLLATQFGMVALAPSLAYLVWKEMRGRRYAAAVAAVLVSGALFSLLLWLSGYTWDLLAEIAGRGGDHILGFLAPANDRQPYAFLSVEHFVEMANLHFLLNPFALVIFLRLFTLKKARLEEYGPVWRFWMLAATCALASSLLLHWDLGLSRDWDVAAVFSLAVIPASLAGVMSAVRDGGQRRRLMVAVAAVMLLHTVPWIAVNADVDRSLARVQMLPEEKVWGTSAWKSFLEELGIYFRDNGRPADAAACYGDYLSLDSTNARIWANYAYVSGEAGAPARELYGNEQAVRYGSTWYGVYANLGYAYAGQGRIPEAVAMFEKSLTLNSAQPGVLNALGALLLEHRQAYAEALHFIAASLAIDSTSASAHLNAGLCSAALHDTAGARRYLSRFLELAPDHPRAAEARRRLGELR